MIIEQIILGFAQGIAEWLPISSEGVIVLLRSLVFKSNSISDDIHLALFLHLGTFLSALVYFRKEVFELFIVLPKLRIKKYQSYSIKEKTLIFLMISTIISALLGITLVKILFSFEDLIIVTGKYITFFIGVFLLITGYVQITAKRSGKKTETNLSPKDSIVLGIAQGFAALPGLSRSGLTVAALLMRQFNETTALKLSFLMSLPIVLLGNIILNLPDFSFNHLYFVGLGVAFIVGLSTIHFFLSFSKKINFGIFVMIFGTITIIAAFV